MKFKKLRLKNKSGFTLIELLIVISIIGILGAILISMINPAEQQRKAKIASINSELSKVAQSVEAYAAECGTYGESVEDLVTGECRNNGWNAATSHSDNLCWVDWSNRGFARGNARPEDPDGVPYTITCRLNHFCMGGLANGVSYVYDSRWGEVRQQAWGSC